MTFAARRLNDSWPTEHVETLRELVAKGLSAGEIAKKIPVSRNAIIGKVHRLGLELAGARRASKPREVKVPKPPKEPKPRPVRTALEGSGTLATRGKRIAVLAEKAKDTTVVSRGVSLLERTGCAFATGQDHRGVLFCNAERLEGSPYCPACRVRMVRPKGAAA